MKTLGDSLSEGQKITIAVVVSAILSSSGVASLQNYIWGASRDKFVSDLSEDLWLASKAKILDEISDQVKEDLSQSAKIEPVYSLYEMAESDLKKAAIKLTKSPDDVKEEDTYKWDRACKGFFGRTYIEKWSKTPADSRYYCDIMIEHRKTLTTLTPNLRSLLAENRNHGDNEKSTASIYR